MANRVISNISGLSWRAEAARPAFTLIELLTVIALVSLLVSILIPTFMGVHELAKRRICQHNLHQIGIALGTYAANNRRAVPPFWSHNDGYVSDNPQHTYFAYLDGAWPAPHPDGGFGTAALNLALLEEAGHVTTAGVFYCPAQSHARHQWGQNVSSADHPDYTHAEVWSRKPVDRRGWPVRTAYQYHPYPVPRRRRLDDFEPDRSIALDILICKAMTAHAEATGWSLLFADGRVEFRSNPAVYHAIPDSGGIPLGFFYGAEDDGTYFSSTLRELETN